MADSTDPSDDFSAGERRRRRRLYLILGALGAWLIGAYVLFVWWPPKLAAAAEEAGLACRIPVQDTGVGDPASCRKAPAFAGVLPSDRARAAAVTWANDYRTTSLEYKLAAFRDLDRARRDERLARLHRLANGHDESFVDPETGADDIGALEALVAMARAPRAGEHAVGYVTPLAVAGVKAAARLGDLDAVAALAPGIVDELGPERRAYLCLAGKGPCEAAAVAGHHGAEIEQALADAGKGISDDVLLDHLGHGGGGWIAWTTYLSPWTLTTEKPLADPAVAEQLAAALRDRADLATPKPPPLKGTQHPRLRAPPPVVTSLLSTSYWIEVEASRARWLLGDVDGARAALGRADELSVDQRLPRAHTRWFYTVALRAVLVEPAAALRWIEGQLADAGDGAAHLHLNRALLLLELGRADEVLAQLPPPRDCGDTDGALCDAIEWVRFAMQLRARTVPTSPDVPRPKPEEAGEEAFWCSNLSGAGLRAVIADAVAGDAAARAKVRWWCQITVGDMMRDDVVPPVRLYAIGFLAGDGDVTVYLDAVDPDGGARHVQRAREVAATLRGDSADATLWRARREALEAALAAHPEVYPLAAHLGL